MAGGDGGHGAQQRVQRGGEIDWEEVGEYEGAKRSPFLEKMGMEAYQRWLVVVTRGGGGGCPWRRCSGDA